MYLLIAHKIHSLATDSGPAFEDKRFCFDYCFEISNISEAKCWRMLEHKISSRCEDCMSLELFE